MVVTRFSVVMGGGRHKAVIATAMVSFVEPGSCVVGVCMEACPSNTDACVPSSDNMDLSGLVSPPPDAIAPFPIIADI